MGRPPPTHDLVVFRGPHGAAKKAMGSAHVPVVLLAIRAHAQTAVTAQEEVATAQGEADRLRRLAADAEGRATAAELRAGPIPNGMYHPC